MRVPFFKMYHVRLVNFHILAFSIKWFPINEIACVRSLIQTKENQNAKKWYIITVISLTWLDLTWLQLTCLLCAKKIGLFALIHGYIKSAVSFYLSLQNTSQHFAANACACVHGCMCVCLFVCAHWFNISNYFLLNSTLNHEQENSQAISISVALMLYWLQ